MIITNGGHIEIESLEDEFKLFIEGKYSKQTIEAGLTKAAFDLRGELTELVGEIHIHVVTAPYGMCAVIRPCKMKTVNKTLLKVELFVSEAMIRTCPKGSAVAFNKLLESVRGMCMSHVTFLGKERNIDIDFSDIFEEEFGYFIQANDIAYDAISDCDCCDPNVVMPTKDIIEKYEDIMNSCSVFSDALAKIAETAILPIEFIDAVRGIYHDCNGICEERVSKVYDAATAVVNEFYNRQKELCTTVEKEPVRESDFKL